MGPNERVWWRESATLWSIASPAEFTQNAVHINRQTLVGNNRNTFNIKFKNSGKLVKVIAVKLQASKHCACKYNVNLNNFVFLNKLH